MTTTACALATWEAESNALARDDLRIFARIPEGHDVATLHGSVVIFQTEESRQDTIEDGAFYVVEDQQPAAGMNWEIYDQLNRNHGPREPRVRIRTRRRVVRVVRCHRNLKRWWHVQPSGYHDGPFEERSVLHCAVGKVVGIYQPRD